MTTIISPPLNASANPPRPRRTAKQAALDALERGLAFDDDAEGTPDATGPHFAEACRTSAEWMNEGVLDLVHPIPAAIILS